MDTRSECRCRTPGVAIGIRIQCGRYDTKDFMPDLSFLICEMGCWVKIKCNSSYSIRLAQSRFHKLALITAVIVVVINAETEVQRGYPLTHSHTAGQWQSQDSNKGF